MSIRSCYSEFKTHTNLLIEDRKNFAKWYTKMSNDKFECADFKDTKAKIEKVNKRGKDAAKHVDDYNEFMGEHWFLGRVFQVLTWRWENVWKTCQVMLAVNASILILGMNRVIKAFPPQTNSAASSRIQSSHLSDSLGEVE